MIDKDIFELMARFNAGAATSFKLTTKEFTLELGKGGGAVSAASAAPAVPAPAPVPEEAGLFITAPLVGTFYAAPAPGEAPFAAPGKQVKKGETLCLIEAMKMMSEVPAPADCVVEEVLGRDGEAVGFGEPLFRIRRV